jgi:hypothetical protein
MTLGTKQALFKFFNSKNQILWAELEQTSTTLSFNEKCNSLCLMLSTHIPSSRTLEPSAVLIGNKLSSTLALSDMIID